MVFWEDYHSYEFVWITDGKGWHSAKNKLEEAYSVIPSLYNLMTLENFVRKVQDETVLEF
ncbi:Type-2 restriction enzyme MboI [Oligella ureolytica]|uniref:DpnII family type II restriction endonuclease n=1 Tax=Oligella ureolytica TaxID=90244 RepID=UPI000E04B699|nr:Type-2 restriction enzyme MboI [Oligella ureolytica]